MAREKNYLLGFGERLTSRVTISRVRGDKQPPYSFDSAKDQLAKRLVAATDHFRSLPPEACPGDHVTAIITMHPRYISKSDFPSDLFDAVGVRAVGGRTRIIRPRAWGIRKHPVEASTDQIFVVGTRAKLVKWARELPEWDTSHKGASDLTHIEDVSAFRAEDKFQAIPDRADEILLEVVLHECEEYSDQFGVYASRHGARPIVERMRSAGGLLFIPVYAHARAARKIAQFSFVRVVRAMPSLRPIRPVPLRTKPYVPISLPDEPELDSAIRAAVFDGGIPEGSPLSRWVSSIDAPGVGRPVARYQDHGIAVTSALLFGPLGTGGPTPRPLCHVDHIRVLDENTGSGGDFEYYDVLDRIMHYLHETPYEFINISIGPDMPISDDEVTRWTAEIDCALRPGQSLVSVAVGNSGELDASCGLNRIQPPSDAVSVLSVGASDCDHPVDWNRAKYSSVGPGRCPGVFKPDGLAFGGSDEQPFLVLSQGSALSAVGVQGTSVAAPYALRTGIAVRAQLGTSLSPLLIRALLLHRAEGGNRNRAEVGWGRFETDFIRLITCDDDEILALYQGELPVSDHLRAPLPIPTGGLKGRVSVTVTIVIAPEVDPSFPNVYTRGGLDVIFRPDTTKFGRPVNGRVPTTPMSKPFFSEKNLYRAGERILRAEGHKWEPCLKATRRFLADGLQKPCLDIYYNTRAKGAPRPGAESIPYALVASVKAPRVPDLYERAVRTYANILVPLQPRLRIQVQT